MLPCWLIKLAHDIDVCDWMHTMDMIGDSWGVQQGSLIEENIPISDTDWIVRISILVIYVGKFIIYNIY